MSPNAAVRIVEVGPRDGLQNESQPVSLAEKQRFIAALAAAGLSDIEATAFVHPKVIPQLADADELARELPPTAGVRWSALAPNERGLERAIAAGVQRIAVFTAASDAFAERNIRMTVDESLAEFERVVPRARDAGITVRGYLSTAFECPYAGRVEPSRVAQLTQRLLEIGVDEVGVSDTIGTAGPNEVEAVLECIFERTPASHVALHLHDTCGTALANVYAGWRMGVRTFDAAAGGLGGCPFAPGAAGNLATEDLVYMLERMGVPTGVSLDGVLDAAALITSAIGREPTSRQWRRLRGDG